MKLEFRRTFSAPPEVVWPYLTIPDRMSLWSEARIEGLRPGTDDRHHAPGAVRRATVPAFGLTTVLDEEIVDADPPRRFVHRVISGGGLRDHRGVQTLEQVTEGTALLWEVSFRAAVPGLALILGAILRPRLERSLTKLEGLIR